MGRLSSKTSLSRRERAGVRGVPSGALQNGGQVFGGCSPSKRAFIHWIAAVADTRPARA